MKNRTVVKNTLIVLIFVVLFPLYLQAETVTDLYHTVVPVTGQSGSERLRAMRVGLGKVLVKVTGDSQALANVSYSNPERYVTAFGYVSYRDPQSPDSSADGLGMSLNFAPSAINKLLRDYRLQLWPSDRPGLLVWMVIDDPVEGRHFVTTENLPEAVATLKMLMKDRGAPLILPLLDLQDSRTITEADVWNLSQTPLAEAAGRYNTGAWLAVRMYQSSSGQWRAARLLYLKGEASLQNVVADNLSALMTKIVPEVVDSLASQYAYVPKTDTETVFLQLENINDYQTFNEAINYLESLEVVRYLSVSEVDHGRLGLRLFVEGEVDLLLDTLRRDRRMAENLSAVDATNNLGAKNIEISEDAEDSFGEGSAIETNPVLANGGGTESTEVLHSSEISSTSFDGSDIGAISNTLPEPKNFYFIWGQR
jgi:hypothetical protein